MRKLSKSRIVLAGLVCVFLLVWPQAGWAVGGDTCATATVISSLPYSDISTTVGANDDYDEICPYDAPGSSDVVYSYTPSSDIAVRIDLCDSSYDTKVYVYEGTCGTYQSGTQIACNDDACGDDTFKSQLPYVNLTGGNTYYIVVDGYGGDAGAYEINITQVSTVTGACCDDATGTCMDDVEQSACTGRFSADTLCADLVPACGEQAGDDCLNATVIPSLPYSDTGTTVGANDDYDEICPYDAPGSPDVVYSYTPSSDIAVRIDLCDSSYDTKVYVYEDTCGAYQSGTQIACNDDFCGYYGVRSKLYASLTGGSTYYIVVDGYGGESGEYNLYIDQFVLTEAGDTCEEAAVIPALPYSATGLTVNANNNYNEVCPDDVFTPDAPDVVFSYTPIVNEVVDINLCGSDYYTKLYVYENTCGAPDSGTQIACDIEGCDGVPPTSQITGLSLTAGNTYYIIVDGVGTQSGLYQLVVTSSSAVVGACCDDSTGTCQDGVAVQNCTGRWSANTLCANLDPPCGSGSTLECPPTTLFGQPPHGPADLWSGPISEVSVGGHVYENFTGVVAPICDIHWWGFQVDPYTFEECIESDPTFEIIFYEDNDGQPGSAVCSYESTAAVTPTGRYYDFGGCFNQLNYYSVGSLSPCCSLTEGWVSITGLGDEFCWFMWISSGVGDGNSWVDDGVTGYSENMDLSVCLTGDVPEIRIEPLSFDDNCPQDPYGSFTIYNDGPVTLNVTGIDAPAWVVEILPVLPYSIPPAANQPVTVELDCCYCAGRGRLQVYSNDLDKSPYPDAVYVNLNVIEGDLDDDCMVQLSDFSHFASYWLQSSCSSPDWCGHADISQDGSVGFEDLAGFVLNWLEELPFEGCEE